MKNLAGKPFALIGVHLNYDANDAPADAAKVKSVMTKNNLNWRSFVDKGPIAKVWKPAGTPAFFIIDPKGVIRYKWAGAPGAQVIDDALEKVLAEAEGKTQDAR